ncbi:kappaPI-actitoxin-Avd3e-like [Actinia tenebrosa]|uniref:KappaPI-actitoxin-Avd3e-like n=1 Tax=Actinia tenebrosa TaxID=6105 RepID=A0A6P8HTQ4_ACTTE|nr:kappaPI-actitoxin-Avd3e-like [Actinia tenebrosa]
MRVLACFLLVIYSSVVNCKDDRMRCSKEKVVGNCKGRIERYYYDKAAKACWRFWYSGCNGNPNNFETRRECQDACMGKGFCLFPPVAGTCKESLPRYYYDNNTKHCKPFTYSGCGGNKNNFKVKDDCLKECRVHFI